MPLNSFYTTVIVEHFFIFGNSCRLVFNGRRNVFNKKRINDEVVKKANERENERYHYRKGEKTEQEADNDYRQDKENHRDIVPDLVHSKDEAVFNKLFQRKVERDHHGEDIEIHAYDEVCNDECHNKRKRSKERRNSDRGV